ncbi:16S rRNA (guanine(527)-N(7))-methyltransferase RsmG [Candidatus Nitrosoglobus terrae]|uniref:16S rRNA (guanine(527)-N(7))-methyltransferase RsmG n=1 Tax=Candidatus Nitrosoglobus terrae TaxID=1630141 RepID=UPI000BBB129D|nr:16S rRNA (guanine(527)-N(7))-methyltransferase RsmG [Candidatus Nitrosoglobus terrae]
MTLMREELSEKGRSTLGFKLTQDQVEKLLQYTQLLEKWNRHYNLTAIRTPTEIISKHLLDSLSIGSYLWGHYILDVGSGAGLPGIPLAIVYPDHQFTLLDSSAKKIRFLTQVSIELKLSNTSIICDRAETYRPFCLFDTIVSRAFAKLACFVALTDHLCNSLGYLLAMKGVFPEEELKALPLTYKVIEVYSLSIPGLSAQRHLVKLGRAGEH